MVTKVHNYTAVSFGSLVIVESIWWFSILAVIGGLLGLGGAPLPWISVMFLLASGVFSAWIFGGVKGDTATVAIGQAFVALIVFYFALATVSVFETWSFKIAWPVDTFGGAYGADGVVDVMFGVLSAVCLWYRAQGLVMEGGVARRLSRAFKLGTAFIAVALLFQHGVIQYDIGIAPLLLPFFGAALIGMAVARIPKSETVSQASWPLVIGISVSVILGLGAFGGVLTGRYGDIGVRGFVNIWGALVDAVLWVLRYPIEWIMTAIWNLILWLQSLSDAEEKEVERDTPGAFAEDMVNPAAERSEEVTNFAIEALRWPLSILLLLGLFFVLIFAYRRFSSRVENSSYSERESIRGEADARADMARLFKNLLPGWLRIGTKNVLWKWPENQSGISEVFLLYFDTIAHAAKLGMTYEAALTPNERVGVLGSFLPDAPVVKITSSFNDACYGLIPSSLDEISQLREELEIAVSKSKQYDYS